MFAWIKKLVFVGILSCLALLLSLVVTTGVASAHTQHTQQVLDSPAWTYSVEDFREAATYAGYSPTDSVNDHYILIDSWWQNSTGQDLYLNAPIFNLTASDGTAYSESDSHANPNNYLVHGYQRITITRSFVVVNNECNFTLTTPYDSSFQKTIASAYTAVCRSGQ